MPPSAEDAPAETLGTYLAAVAEAVRAGLPPRSWVEATVLAAKAGPHGHGLSLVDPAGGANPAQMRAFLRASDRLAIADRLGTAFDPAHIVGLTVTSLIEPDFSPRWGMGGRVVDLSASSREALVHRAVEESRKRLVAERLYDRQSHLPTPSDVLRAAVVHPVGAAGYADVSGELARWQAAGILHVHSTTAPFEGPRAAREIAAALQRAVTAGGEPPDVVLLIRGGGDRAGLLALDDELVARAVCGCPVPVITGLGHASDRSLADEVAWVARDTPSKALAHLASLIAAPARRARADMASVTVEADRRLAASEHALEALQFEAAANAGKVLHAADSALAAMRTGVEVAAASAGQRCSRLAGEARMLLAAVLERGPARLGEAGHRARRLAAEALVHGRRRSEGTDDGEALWHSVQARATARLDAADVACRRLAESLPLGAARRLTDAGVELARLAALTESFGLDATLRRGFVLATTREGRLVPTRAAALAARAITLHFADGTASAHVGADLTTTQHIGASA